MAEKDLTMEDDWGAKGAQATGAQVQKFIKSQFQALHEKDTALQKQLNSLNSDPDDTNPQLRVTTDGCFVAFTKKSDHCQHAVPWWEWPAKEEDGEVADGVLVLIDGQAPIIVSPTQATLFWSKNAIAVNVDIGADINKAYVDYSGKTRTAAIMSKATELFGEEENWVQYAPAWCNAYSRNHDKGDGTMIGIGPGKWWLPSIAELIIIWKHKYAINQCLSVISGASQLSENLYLSSTESSATGVWHLYLNIGFLYGFLTKTGIRGCVRAVTAFH